MADYHSFELSDAAIKNIEAHGLAMEAEIAAEYYSGRTIMS